MRKIFALRGEGFHKNQTRQLLFSPFEIFGSAEQAALQLMSSRGARAERAAQQFVGTEFSEQFVSNNALQGTEAIALQAILTGQVSEFLASHKDSVEEASRFNSISIFANPIIQTELSRDGDQYISRLFGSSHSDWNRVTKELTTLFTRFGGDKAARHLNRIEDDRNFDDLILDRFKRLTTTNWEDLAGLSAHDEKQQIPRAELSALASSCVTHLYGAYRSPDPLFGNESSKVCSGLVRAQIRDWYLTLKKSRGLNRAQAIKGDFVPRHAFDEPLNILPYVSIEPLDDRFSSVMVMVVRPFDTWFVDERVDEEFQIPSVSMSIYDTSELRGLRIKDLREAQFALRSCISSLTHRLMAQDRGDTLALAAGEAAQISRYWYNEGIAKLFDQDNDRRGLEVSETDEFWERFVEDLLCAKIDGIKEVEVYPFDRAIIIQRTGSQPEAGDQKDIEITVLETGLLSKSPKDQGQILTSPERINRDLGAEFDLTQKSVIFKAKYNCSARPNSKSLVDISAVSKDHRSGHTTSKSHVEVTENSGASLAELSMHALLNHLVANEDDKKVKSEDDSVTLVREMFDSEADGVLFSYESGLRVLEEAPHLTQFLGRHFEFLHQSASSAKWKVADHIKDLGSTDSKLVTFVFDTKQSKRNQRGVDAKESNYFLDDSHSVTIILMGDEDIEKSVQDVTAEREDLKLLLNMIVRQKIQDKQKEEGILRNRLQTIEAVLQGIFHKISAMKIDPVEKKKIEMQWMGAKRLMAAENGAQEELVITSADEFLSKIAPDLVLDDAGQQADIAAVLKKSMDAYASNLVDSFRAAVPSNVFRDLSINLTTGYLPQTKLAFPRAAIRECFDVLLKNAIEASSVLPAHLPADIAISIETRPSGDDRHMLDIRIDNCYSQLNADAWAALSAKQPIEAGRNSMKEKATGHSTGLGVYAARQLLQMGYGSGADIYFEPLGPNRLRARMSLPCKIETPSLTQDNVVSQAQQISVDNGYILYVEDDESVHEEGKAFLENTFQDVTIKATDNANDAIDMMEQHLPLFLLTDFNVLGAAGGTGTDAHGRSIVLSFFKAAQDIGEDRKCVILSGNDSQNIISKLSDGLPDGVTMGTMQPFGTDTIQELQFDITIIKGLKDPGGFPDLVRFIEKAVSSSAPKDPDTLEQPPVDHIAPDLPQPRLFTAKKIETVLKKVEDGILKDSASDQSQFIRLTGVSHVSFLAQWFGHPGVQDRQVRNDDSLWPLWNADYNPRMVGLTAIPEGWDSISYRNWLMTNKVLAESAFEQFGEDFWLTFPNESGGFLSRLRHDVRNIRINAPDRDIFSRIEKGTIRLEGKIAFEARQNIKDELLAGDEAFEARIEALAKSAAKKQTAREAGLIFDQLDELQDNLSNLRGQIHPNEARPVETVMRIEHSLRTFRILVGATRDGAV